MQYNSSFLFYSYSCFFSRSWSLFLDMGVRYSANSTLSCCTASSLEPCTLYTHMKGSFFVLLGKYASVSLIFFRCWLLHRCHFFFCVFCHFQLLCSTIRCLQFCPIKSPHHEKKFFFPWNAKKIIKSDALLQISSHAHCSRARWILWVILQAYF